LKVDLLTIGKQQEKVSILNHFQVNQSSTTDETRNQSIYNFESKNVAVFRNEMKTNHFEGIFDENVE
jgi:hypothetical protein